jgi:hypothetical protein|tara:strand:- start:84 stop:227 length:144 start_codon:yes stop_codon:yes gene_type:complete
VYFDFSVRIYFWRVDFTKQNMEKRILQKMCGIEKDIGSWKNKKEKQK